MSKLKLKVTEKCNANCLCCQTRLERYMDSDEKYIFMPYDIAKKCIDEAAGLGWNKLIISGGEPTLCPDLGKIIQYGKKKKMKVSLYTNGSLLDNEYLDMLANSHLDVIMLSYYSPIEETFTKIRQSSELYQKATKAISLLKIKKAEKFPVEVRLQVVMMRENYMDIPKLLCIALENGFDTLSISYLEHATANMDLYMEKNDIEIFKTEIVTQLIKIIEKSCLCKKDKEINIKNLEKLFSEKYREEKVDISNGIYRTTAVHCINKNNYIVVGPSGKALPCCGVEYYPQMGYYGDVKESSIAEVMTSKLFRGFWESEKEICKNCAVERHFYLLTNQYN